MLGPVVLVGRSWHTLQALAAVSALDMLSNPVSLSMYPPAKCSSRSSLVSDESSLASESAGWPWACAVKSGDDAVDELALFFPLEMMELFESDLPL